MTLEVFLMDFCLSVLQLATCIAKDANPAANITWLKNNKPLVDGGKGVLLCYKTHHCIVNINGIINVMKTHVSKQTFLHGAKVAVKFLFVSGELLCACRRAPLRACCLFFAAGVSIRTSVQVDPVSGLSSTSSTLEYSATKEDTDAQFSCSAQHNVGKELASSALTFTITCEPNAFSPFGRNIAIVSLSFIIADYEIIIWTCVYLP